MPAPVALREKVRWCDALLAPAAKVTVEAVVAVPVIVPVNDPSKFATTVPTEPV